MLLNLLEDHPFFRVKPLVGVLRFAPLFPLAVVAGQNPDLNEWTYLPYEMERCRGAGCNCYRSNSAMILGYQMVTPMRVNDDAWSSSNP